MCVYTAHGYSSITPHMHGMHDDCWKQAVCTTSPLCSPLTGAMRAALRRGASGLRVFGMVGGSSSFRRDRSICRLLHALVSSSPCWRCDRAGRPRSNSHPLYSGLWESRPKARGSSSSSAKQSTRQLVGLYGLETFVRSPCNRFGPSVQGKCWPSHGHPPPYLA